ncbi:hypothetical protein NHQ30_001924 [Ciborinia camelliae]|nr:hypothetical protein NHQ30_001924 [Ciborinia camelliae]
MVKFTSIALFLAATASVQAVSSQAPTATVVAACNYCQCHDAAGSPCCVTPNHVSHSAMDCQAFCKKAYRLDGGYELDPAGYIVEGTSCHAGDSRTNFQCITWAQVEAAPWKCVAQ